VKPIEKPRPNWITDWRLLPAIGQGKRPNWISVGKSVKTTLYTI